MDDIFGVGTDGSCGFWMLLDTVVGIIGFNCSCSCLMLFDTSVDMFDVGIDCPCCCSVLLDTVVDIIGFDV